MEPNWMVLCTHSCLWREVAWATLKWSYLALRIHQQLSSGLKNFAGVRCLENLYTSMSSSPLLYNSCMIGSLNKFSAICFCKVLSEIFRLVPSLFSSGLENTKLGKVSGRSFFSSSLKKENRGETFFCFNFKKPLSRRKDQTSTTASWKSLTISGLTLFVSW